MAVTDDGKDFQYVYDAFGRLRRVKSISSGKVVAEYWYNALGHRIAERHDWNLDGEADGDDPTFHAIHDARWRRVGTVRSEGGVMDDEPKELWAHHAAGLAGLGGSSYIDSVIMRDRDTAADWEEEASGVLGQRVYPLQNWRADVSVVVNHDGSRVLEWVKYSAYGVPTLLAAYDADCNGVRNSTDLSVFSTLWTAGGSTYDVRADYNLDGTVNSTDLSAHTNDWQSGNSQIGRGYLSRSDSTTKVFNRTGYAGCRWDPVVGSYHARNRDLDPAAGRWNRRDPLGYVDGMSLYQYVRGNPIRGLDPLGLVCTEWPCKVPWPTSGPNLEDLLERRPRPPQPPPFSPLPPYPTEPAPPPKAPEPAPPPFDGIPSPGGGGSIWDLLPPGLQIGVDMPPIGGKCCHLIYGVPVCVEFSITPQTGVCRCVGIDGVRECGWVSIQICLKITVEFTRPGCRPASNPSIGDNVISISSDTCPASGWGNSQLSIGAQLGVINCEFNFLKMKFSCKGQVPPRLSVGGQGCATYTNSDCSLACINEM